jgi:far upstream element-binding protein
MKAKLMGNLAEHERLSALIARAKADGSAAPPPPPQPASARPAHADASERERTVQLAVPLSAVGVIIGKGGATIDALQAESGAQIRVPRGQDAEGGEERVVLISGSAVAIDKAQVTVTDAL